MVFCVVHNGKIVLSLLMLTFSIATILFSSLPNFLYIFTIYSPASSLGNLIFGGPNKGLVIDALEINSPSL